MLVFSQKARHLNASMQAKNSKNPPLSLSAPKRSRGGRTGRRGYRTHDAAMLAACGVMARPQCNTRLFRAYHYDFCNLWHLTSKEARQQR